MTFLEIAKKIGNGLSGIPLNWSGKESIIEMKNANSRHWKQTEWIGWYFQFFCEQNLADIMEIPGPKYGNSGFDGFLEIPWDFKAHAINTSSHNIIVNDSEATAKAIEKYGAVGLILALGEVIYNDKNRTFQKWHEKIKGGPSKYSIEREKRGAWSRLRKFSLDLKQISFIHISDNTLIKCGSFQEGFRNSDGSPRRKKIMINLEKIDKELAYFLEF